MLEIAVALFEAIAKSLSKDFTTDPLFLVSLLELPRCFDELDPAVPPIEVD
jgi:hypothetical protein